MRVLPGSVARHSIKQSLFSLSVPICILRSFKLPNYVYLIDRAIQEEGFYLYHIGGFLFVICLYYRPTATSHGCNADI
jgi:hypothetical protein